MSTETKVYWRTIFAVVLIGALCFAASALYDKIAGGPEARQASLDANAVLNGFDEAQARSECVTSYTVADSTASALLDIAIGNVVTDAIVGDVSEVNLHRLEAANAQRFRYLILRTQTNQRCDPSRPGGPQPLPREDTPDVNSDGE